MVLFDFYVLTLCSFNKMLRLLLSTTFLTARNPGGDTFSFVSFFVFSSVSMGPFLSSLLFVYETVSIEQLLIISYIVVHAIASIGQLETLEIKVLCQMLG